jgi:Ca-activated chloride channel homolog
MTRSRAARLALVAIALPAITCHGRPSSGSPGAAAAPAPFRPAPGADIGPPPPLPKLAPRRPPPPSRPRPIDLGTDRKPAPVGVPSPPRGGAVGFVFGDQRRGWATRLPDGQQIPALAYGRGKVFASGGFETYSFYALDAHDGRIVWSADQLPDNGPTAPIYDDEDDSVIFNTESCTLIALSAKTGKLLWKRWLGDPTLAQVALADGLIFAAHPGPSSYRLSAFRVTNGARVWSSPVDDELLATPVVAGDSVYASTIAGNSYRFVHRTGKKMWARRLHATTAPFVAGDELHVTRRSKAGEAQVVVSAATGAILREHAAVAAPYLSAVPRTMDNWKALWAFEGSRPVVARGVRYVARGGFIEAADPDTGAEYWIRRDAAAGGVRSVGSVAVAGPQLVVSTRAGQLYGLDVDTGYTLWAYDVGHPVVAQPIVARGWVYVATKDGMVVALEVADPTLDGWHMFGGNARHNS